METVCLEFDFELNRPLLISTGLLKYPLELKKRIQLVYTEKKKFSSH